MQVLCIREQSLDGVMVAPAEPFGESWRADQLSSRRAALVIHGAVGRRKAGGASNAEVIGNDSDDGGTARVRRSQLRARRGAAVAPVR
jgi:hypothetical protein